MIDPSTPGDKKAVLMSQLFPEEFLLNKLGECVAKVKAKKTKENVSELEHTCALYLAKQIVSRDGLENTIAELDKMHKGTELLTPRNN